MPKLTIAIDGPAGSGKSSVARRVAAMLGYLYLDSGAMYRALALKAVRRVLVAEQQRAGAGGGIVMEGRDIGTIVFPRAELKVFLDASPEVRAERRWKEHQEKGEHITLPEVFDEVIERDKRDRERKVSPLVRASDAVLVDNTAMGVEETARLVVMLAREREKESADAAGGQP